MTQPAGPALRARELGEAVNGHPEKVDAALPELAALLAVSTDDEVILETVQALNHASDERAVRLLLPLARAGHPNAEIRQAVAAGLASGDESENVRAQVIAALVPMTADPVAAVRDWACFSLGAVSADGDEVREALAARLDDENADTRAEALVALAKTGDPRALDAVLARLTVDDTDSIYLLELQSAGELADPALLPALSVLAANWGADDDEHTELLERVQRRCAVDAASRAAVFEKQLKAGLQARFQDAGFTVELEGSYPRTRVRFLRNGVRGPGHPLRLWEFLEAPDSIDLEQELASWQPEELSES